MTNLCTNPAEWITLTPSTNMTNDKFYYKYIY